MDQYLRQFEFKPKNQISQLYESIGYSSKKTKKLPFFHLGEGIDGLKSIVSVCD
jgi:hypothetical protein